MKNEFKAGILFSAIGQYGNVVIQLLINVILSRLLTPKEFGVIAIVQVLLLFFQILSGQSISPAIIQNKNLNKKDYGVIFNYMILLGVSLAIIFGFSGILLSKIYGNEIYLSLSWLMSILIIADSLSCVPNGILYKEKRFKEINIRLIISLIIGAVIGISAAFLGAGVYSLIIISTVPAVVSLFFNLLLVDIQYTRSMDIKPIKEIIFFTKHQTAFSLINYLYRNMDNLLVGKFLGATNLGNYSKGYQLISFPITVFLGVINPVLQPILSEHETDVDLIRETYLTISRVLSLIALPVSVFMCLNADQIIYFLFGSQWSAAISPFAILSLSIWAQMLAQMISVFWQSRNLPHIQSRNGFISLFIIGISIIVGIYFGSIKSVALAVTVSYIINFFISASLLLRIGLNGSIYQLLRMLIKPFVLSAIIIIIFMITMPYLTFNSYFMTLLVRGLIWLFIVVLFYIFTKEFQVMKKILKRG